MEWRTESLRPHREAIPGRWFADNTREPIRDETLKEGLKGVGAVVERRGLPTSSARPRWALAADFAELFQVDDTKFSALLDAWREAHLTRAALTRIRLVQQGLGPTDGQQVQISFPSGQTRRMAPGVSSQITKSVIEVFAPRFLRQPGVLWVSESANKVVLRDRKLAESVGLSIEADRLLPDILLVDLGLERRILFVFVEVVATDGPITEQRRRQLIELVETSGHAEDDAAFVTAFLDRSKVYPRISHRIGWDSFVWYASEPEKIVSRVSTEIRPAKLIDLLGRT